MVIVIRAFGNKSYEGAAGPVDRIMSEKWRTGDSRHRTALSSFFHEHCLLQCQYDANSTQGMRSAHGKSTHIDIFTEDNKVGVFLAFIYTLDYCLYMHGYP